MLTHASIGGQSNQPIFTNQEQPRFHLSTLGDVALLRSMYFSKILWCFKVDFPTMFILWAFTWTALCQRGRLAVRCFLVEGSHAEWCLKQLYAKHLGTDIICCNCWFSYHLVKNFVTQSHIYNSYLQRYYCFKSGICSPGKVPCYFLVRWKTSNGGCLIGQGYWQYGLF